MNAETLRRIEDYKRYPELIKILAEPLNQAWAGIHEALEEDIVNAANKNKNGDGFNEYMTEVQMLTAEWLSNSINKKMPEIYKQYFADMIRLKAYQLIKGTKGGRRRRRTNKSRKSRK
jgi:hypothetical protein